MKIVNTQPPNIELIRAVLAPRSDAVFCYGGVIYNPSGKELLPDIIHHEEVHKRQQGDAPDLWWTCYLTDRDFRMVQELEAYGAQFKFAKDAGVKGKMADWLLDNLASALSSDYGLDISFGEARSKIRNLTGSQVHT